MSKRYLVAMVGAVVALAGAELGHAEGYVGAQRCQSCHAFEYEKWASGPHARAHLSLSESERQDPKCRTCHTMATAATASREVGVQGIGCERCHGPGRYYQADYVMRDRELARAVGLIDPQPSHCVVCHNAGAPNIEPFDYERFWARIAHDRAAREAWLAKQAQQTITPNP